MDARPLSPRPPHPETPGPGAPGPTPAVPAVPAEAPMEVVEIPIEALVPDPFQPRKEFNEPAIRSLADSIDQHGILQPLLVRPMQGPNSRGRYWIVAGERRYRAGQLLGMRSLPCRIRPYENTAAAVVALAENVHREDLNEIEKAEALQRIRTLTDKTWDEVSELVKLSRDYVKRLVGLLKLQEPVKEKVRSGEISARCAIALKPLPGRQQLEMAERVIREGLSAEQIRLEARKHSRDRSRRESRPAPGPLGGGVPRPGSEGARPAREGPVVSTVRDCAEAVHGVEKWLDSREWSPSRVSDAQREALDELYQRVTLLQQYLLFLRSQLAAAEEPEAEKLRKISTLPF